MKRVFLLFILISLICIFFTACEEKGNKDATYLKRKISQAEASGDTATAEQLKEKLSTLGHWFRDRVYMENITKPVDTSDELQKTIYSFDPNENVHTLTLDYEPISGNSKIPAYQQKCVCTLGEMPFDLEKGQSYRVEVSCEYAESNEYAGISNSCWLESDNEAIKIVNNDGYTKGEVYAGEREEGRHDSLHTSFTITVPEEPETYNFNIKFISDCGETLYNYLWTDEYID